MGGLQVSPDRENFTAPDGVASKHPKQGEHQKENQGRDAQTTKAAQTKNPRREREIDHLIRPVKQDVASQGQQRSERGDDRRYARVSHQKPIYGALRGKKIEVHSVKDAMRVGIAYLPEERKSQ